MKAMTDHETEDLHVRKHRIMAGYTALLAKITWGEGMWVAELFDADHNRLNALSRRGLESLIELLEAIRDDDYD